MPRKLAAARARRPRNNRRARATESPARTVFYEDRRAQMFFSGVLARRASPTAFWVTTERIPVPEDFSLSSNDRERDLPLTEAAHRLSHVLQVDQTDGRPSGALREAICDLVSELKTAGLAPERVLVRVKEVVASARSEHPTPDRDEEQKLLQQVITLHRGVLPR